MDGMARAADAKTTTRTVWIALLLVVILAAALRIWGMDYGVPHPTVRPDEERIVGRAQHILATGDLNPVSYAYPGLMIHLNALALGVFAWVGRLLGFYDSLFDFLLDVAVTRPGLHYVICRAVSVAMGVGTVVATFFLAREGYRSQVVGLVAALALATNYLHVRDSHFATVDIGMTFFVALSLVFAIKASSNHRWKNYLLAGLFAGAAAAAKYNAGLVILAPVAACASGMLRGRNGIVPRLLVALVVMVAAFALLSPYSLIYYPAALDELAGVRRYVYGEGGARALWVHLKVTFPEGYGWLFFIAAVAGIVRAVWLRRPADLTLLAFLVPFFLLVASVDTVFPRYVLPLTPILSVLAAELVVSSLAGRRRSLVVAATVALVGPGLWKSVQVDRLLAREDTRLMASHWVAENLPRRASILVCRGYGAPAINSDRRRPPAFDPQEIPCSLGAIRENEATYLVTHEHPSLSSSRILPPALLSFLEEQGNPLVRFDPFRTDFRGNAYYYGADSFYLPFSGLGSVDRGGPKITIWELARGARSVDDTG